VIWSVLLIEPASANFNIKTVYSSCGKEVKTSSCCSKSKCKKPTEKKEKNDCESNRCNPLMSCPTGNFYFFNHPQLSLALLKLITQKTILVNDNRISKYLSKCWHPPEII